MYSFNVGDTLNIGVEVMDSIGTYKNPSTSMVVTITAPNGVDDVTEVAMTAYGGGRYLYTWASSGKAKGEWTVKFKATDGTEVSTQTDKFKLE